jgi:hypothetical protein
MDGAKKVPWDEFGIPQPSLQVPHRHRSFHEDPHLRKALTTNFKDHHLKKAQELKLKRRTLYQGELTLGMDRFTYQVLPKPPLFMPYGWQPLSRLKGRQAPTAAHWS